MKIETKAVEIAGPVGAIEAVLDSPEVSSIHSYVSINCHPHSLHGGTMTNKVVHTVSRSIAACGIPSIRFNFRGVGKSAGNYDEGVGEREDLSAVVDWMKKTYPNSKVILTGFSFGSYVSAFASEQINPNLLISVAPPVKRFDFNGFIRPDCEWHVIMGTADELVEFSEVEKWVGEFEKSPELTVMAEASHFFHGRLIELREHVERIISLHVS